MGASRASTPAAQRPLARRPCASGDPVRACTTGTAYDVLRRGVRIGVADLKTELKDRRAVHRELARTDALAPRLLGRRPLSKLGLDWPASAASATRLAVHRRPSSAAPGARAEAPGHDLTYLAENGLVTGIWMLPPTLYADMAGSLMASEAVLTAVLMQQKSGKGLLLEVALSGAAGYLALPRNWGLTQPGAAVGGGPRWLPRLPLQGRPGGGGGAGAALRGGAVRSGRHRPHRT